MVDINDVYDVIQHAYYTLAVGINAFIGVILFHETCEAAELAIDTIVLITMITLLTREMQKRETNHWNSAHTAKK